MIFLKFSKFCHVAVPRSLHVMSDLSNNILDKRFGSSDPLLVAKHRSTSSGQPYRHLRHADRLGRHLHEVLLEGICQGEDNNEILI